METDKTISPHFPLQDVSVCRLSQTREVKEPVFTNSWMSISQTEFAMEVADVGTFYAGRGAVVEYTPAEGVSKESLELYMNGSVYGAILHQRRILPLHGSSFVWKEKGVMLCGNSGAGKSSITASFCMNGAGFLTDDVTPIVFRDSQPHILPCSDRIKLWDNSLKQFSEETSGLAAIAPGQQKFYYPIQRENTEPYPLNIIFLIEAGDFRRIDISPVSDVSIITALRDEIYRIEFLNVLPGAEAHYFQQLMIISREVHAVRVQRPAEIPIDEMRVVLDNYISSFGML